MEVCHVTTIQSSSLIGPLPREEFVSAILEREKFSSFLAAKIFNIFG